MLNNPSFKYFNLGLVINTQIEGKLNARVSATEMTSNFSTSKCFYHFINISLKHQNEATYIFYFL
jgi:hypothetical protein